MNVSLEIFVFITIIIINNNINVTLIHDSLLCNEKLINKTDDVTSFNVQSFLPLWHWLLFITSMLLSDLFLVYCSKLPTTAMF